MFDAVWSCFSFLNYLNIKVCTVSTILKYIHYTIFIASIKQILLYCIFKRKTDDSCTHYKTVHIGQADIESQM